MLSGSVPISGQSLLEDLQNVADTDVFGKPLTQPYQSSDGNQEQVFESIVLYRDIYNGVVSARPITVQLGLPSTAPGEKLYGSDQGVVFYALSDGLGYHVPILFDEFINEHGGTTFSGDPIAELTEAQPGIYRQCFTNYCLEYSPDARKNHQITVTSLGSQYLQLEQPQILIESTVENTPQTLSLLVNALYNPLSSEQTQQINIVVLNSADQLPLTGIEADLVVTLPDGRMVSEKFPATLTDGSSSLDLPNIKKVANGSILVYQVCATLTTEQTCQTGYYLVWTNP